MAEGNAVHGVAGKLNLVSGFVNNIKVSTMRDSVSTLIGVKKDLTQPEG